MSLANQYSFVIFSAAAVIGVLLFLRWRRASFRVLFAGGLLVSALALMFFFVLRPGASDVGSVTDAQRLLNNGRPTLLEFFSNYCAGCLISRPEVDTLVNEVASRYPASLNILRVDIHTDFGRDLRAQYEFQYTPEFVLFDRAGVEVWRSHAPPSLGQIEAVLEDGRFATADSQP
jgi:thiol-disulfide isomerase/thioredoxin